MPEKIEKCTNKGFAVSNIATTGGLGGIVKDAEFFWVEAEVVDAAISAEVVITCGLEVFDRVVELTIYVTKVGVLCILMGFDGDIARAT